MVLPIVGKDKPGCGGQLKRQVIRGGKTSYEATITMEASYIHICYIHICFLFLYPFMCQHTHG